MYCTEVATDLIVWAINAFADYYTIFLIIIVTFLYRLMCIEQLIQMSQMMETQNYLLKVVMKQEWPSLPKHSHIY